MANGSFTITGLSATEPAGERKFGPISIMGGAVIGETLETVLASGENTVTVPTGATAVLIVPPESGSAELKLKSKSSDTGIVISESNPTLWSFKLGITSFIVVSGSAGSKPATFAFI